MKMNRRIFLECKKMKLLGISEEKRRQYIEKAYCFIGRLFQLPNCLDAKIHYLSETNASPEKAISEIENDALKIPNSHHLGTRFDPHRTLSSN